MFAKLYVKLYLSFLLIFIVTQLVSYSITSRTFRSSLHQELGTQFRHEAQFLKDQFRKNCGDLATPSCKTFLRDASTSLNWSFWVVAPDGKTILSEASHPLNLTSDQLTKAGAGRLVEIFVPETPYVILYPLENNRAILALVREMPVRRPRPSFLNPFITATFVIAILVLPLSIRITRPLRRLHNLAAEWSEGRLERRINVKGHDEIADLSLVFNNMAANLKRIIDQRKEFLALISHELKSPLTRMRLAIQMLADRSQDEKSRKLIEKTQREISESEELVEKILELSKVEMNVSIPTTQQANLQTVLNASLSDVTPIARANQIRLDFEVAMADRSNVVVAGDPQQLQHAFSNIIENAVKFSPPDTQVQVFLKRETGAVCVEIVDQGPGIPKEESQKIFEPFYRGRTTNGRKGTGLGLYISLRIIEDHQGSIVVRPNQPTGTRILVKLPFQTASDPNPF